MIRHKLEQFIRWARDVEWALVSTAVAGVIALIPEFIKVLEGELDQVSDLKHGWPAILFALLGWAIRQNVWSKATVVEIAGTDGIEDDHTPMTQASEYVGTPAGERAPLRRTPGV